VHADHITGTGLIKKQTNFKVQSVLGKKTIAKADVYVDEGLLFFIIYSLLSQIY
jgi:hypothetical protein